MEKVAPIREDESPLQWIERIAPEGMRDWLVEFCEILTDEYFTRMNKLIDKEQKEAELRIERISDKELNRIIGAHWKKRTKGMKFEPAEAEVAVLAMYGHGYRDGFNDYCRLSQAFSEMEDLL